jgi:murein DD-endopeptidase MepM/ murein hydrolase activator NlpD
MRKSYFELIIIALVVVLSVFLVWNYSAYQVSHPRLSLIPEAETDSSSTVIQLYGIPVDSFSIGGGMVRSNQVLSGLLNYLGVSVADINVAMEKADQIFDVRKFKAGNRYITFSNRDSIPRLQYFVYEKDAVNYLVFRFKDSIDAWNGIKQIDTIKNTFAGSIQTSLWNTFEDVGSNPMMANQLSEIYAWSIDFFGLQEGDSLRVVYDEYYVDSVSIGIGEIHGAWFRHMNTDFWAIPFVQDSVLSFFDDKGLSLRKAFLKAPLKFSRISSRFSNSRMHPILKIRRPHYGIDYSAPIGTPVYSIGDGLIVQTGYSGGAGNMVKIRHNSVYTTVYMHLSKYASGIRQGVYVKQGDVIGYVGSTGLSTGPHLDFRFFKNGGPVDPLKVEAPSVDPIKQENAESFGLKKTAVTDEVNRF